MFPDFSGRRPEEASLGHMVDLFVIFRGTSTLFSVVVVPVSIPASSVRRFVFFYDLSTLVISEVSHTFF